MQATEREKELEPECCSTDLLGKMCPLVQQWHEHYGSDCFLSGLEAVCTRIMFGTVNLVKTL